MKPGLVPLVATFAFAAPALLAGCEAAPAIRPGLAAVRIEVVARPKTGYQAPTGSPYGSSSTPDPRYVPVDYSRLENVIVWLEPEGQADAPDQPPAAVHVRLVHPKASAPMAWYVACADAAVTLQNGNPSPDRFYSVSEGNHFDTGELASNAEATVVLHAISNRDTADSGDAPAALVEVFSMLREEPVAGIVVAPTIWAANTRSGRAVTFTDLPAGAVRVVCWHPRLPGAEQRIQLRPDELTRTRIRIGVDSLPPLESHRAGP